jgi:oligoribonuclease NrnB/cAMP/cGMP phosphodiesterase (DHH superfamily)
MRIVTRPDFDGIVCDVLLRNIFEINTPTQWVEPYEIEKFSPEIADGDIVSNLPFVQGCSLWFDHHLSNKTDADFNGEFCNAPSAAGIIFKYYQNRFTKDFKELVFQTDRIDSGEVTIDEVLHLENYPYAMLSSTISGRDKSDETYWNRVVKLLGEKNIEEVLADDEVHGRCSKILEQDKSYANYIREYTQIIGKTAVTDFRSLDNEPKGNRFLIYSLLPEIYVDVKIRYSKEDRNKVIVSLGKNIFNTGCKANLGDLASQYDGGGHIGAGSCSFHKNDAEINITRILEKINNN